MSASSQGIKLKFGGFFKQLFNRSSAKAAVPETEVAPEPEVVSSQPAYVPQAASHLSSHVSIPTQAPKPVVHGVPIPLQAILAGFPLELRPKIRQHETGDLTITIPFEKVLPQLSSGVVKVAYGDIRRVAAQLFAPGIESDGVTVALPLNEILSRINPAMLVRRTSQKHVIVPEDIASPFSGHGNGENLLVGNTNPAPSAVPQPAGPAPVASVPGARPANAPGNGGTTTFQRKSMSPAGPTSVPMSEPIFARKPSLPPPSTVTPTQAPLRMPGSEGTTTFQRKTMTPAGPASVPMSEPIFARKVTPPPAAAPALPPPAAAPAQEMPIFQRKPMAPAAPAPVAPVIHAAPTAPVVPANPIAFKPAPQAAPAAPISFKPAAPAAPDELIFSRKPMEQPADPAPASPIAPASPAPSAPPRPKDFLAAPPVARTVQPSKPPTSSTPPANETQVLLAPLTALAESWPEALREELVKSKLVDARLAMPVDLVEASLKRGRVAFPWKTIRSWIRPNPPTQSSPHDSTEVELPLNVIAPLFVARQGKADRQSKPAVDETIPNLFFGLPTPEPSHTPKPADTNYYTFADSSDAAHVDDTEFKRKAGGTDFVSRYATPNEIVSRAAALDGVAGALIALPDGLMVASRIPQDFNGDTLAAFLPQIFSKVSQCTKELRMGDLNNLNFTVGTVPWKIFRVNAIFFAVLGRPGETMPGTELAALAAELDRRR